MRVDILLTAIGVVASLLSLSRLPDAVSLPWAVAPSARLVAVAVLPLAMIALNVVARLLPRIDPRGRNYAEFTDTYWRLMTAAAAFLLALHLLMLGGALGVPGLGEDRWSLLAGGLALVFGGNYLTRVQPNWFVGIRTPWTLSSDTVWRRTHRLGGWLTVLGGAVVIALAFVRPGPVLPSLAVVFAVVAGVSLLYSFVLWRQERQPTTPSVPREAGSP